MHGCTLLSDEPRWNGLHAELQQVLESNFNDDDANERARLELARSLGPQFKTKGRCRAANKHYPCYSQIQFILNQTLSSTARSLYECVILLKLYGIVGVKCVISNFRVHCGTVQFGIWTGSDLSSGAESSRLPAYDFNTNVCNVYANSLYLLFLYKLSSAPMYKHTRVQLLWFWFQI